MRIPSARRPLFRFYALSSEPVDGFCIDTLLGGGEKLVKILVTLTSFSRSQGHYETSKIWFTCVIF